MKKMKKILFGKMMGLLLAVSVMVSMVLPMETYAAEADALAGEDHTNMFVGTINGEDVVGYLDVTYVYYLGGKDYNASFVIFDENGAPKYEVHMCIKKDVPVGTYSDSGQYDKNKVSVSAYMLFNETKQKFTDYYTFKDSEKSWTVELTGAEYADDGVFEGTLNGTCMAGPYNNTLTYTEVTISGSFNFQMKTIHPTMETYRKDNPEYNNANEISYVQSFGGSVSSNGSSSSSSSSSSSVDHTCRTCGGTGSCKKCYGSGWISNSYNGKLQRCMRCQGSGRCAVCAGTGSVN